MNNLTRTLLIAGILGVGTAGTVTLTGCQRGPAQQAGRDIDRAAEDTRDAIEDTARDVRRAAEDAVRDVERAIEDATD